MLYDFLGREDINWRALSAELARGVYQDNDLGPRPQRAFVVDDASPARAGRKVQGTSCYFDHTEGRNRKGHQVLELGLAGEKGFLPVEAQIVTGEKAAVIKPQDRPFRDQRGAAARDMRRAQGVLQGLIRELGRTVVKRVPGAIDQSVEEFLNQALHITPQQVSVQLKAEELGYLVTPAEAKISAKMWGLNLAHHEANQELAPGRRLQPDPEPGNPSASNSARFSINWAMMLMAIS